MRTTLLLSRRQGEAIVIGPSTLPTIVRIERATSQVRLSVQADENTTVHRQEVANAIACGGNAEIERAAAKAIDQEGGAT